MKIKKQSLRISSKSGNNGWRIVIIVVGLILVTAGIGLIATKSSQASRLALDAIWQDVAESSIPNRSARQITPAAYRTLQLNINALKQLLEQVPLEFTRAAKESPVEVTIPMPDGTFIRFEVMESRIMQPGLAAKFPEIRNYRGFGIDDRQAIIGFSVTPTGFHAYILSGAGAVAIDPYAEGDTAHYISYYKRHDPAENDFTCLTPDPQKLDIPRTPNRSPNFSSGETLRTYRYAVAATGEWTAAFGTNIIEAMSVINSRLMGINMIYEHEVGIRLVLVDNEDSIIYFDASTDPYPSGGGANTSAIIFENGLKTAQSFPASNPVNETLTVFQGINFADVPANHLFYNEIGKLSARGVTLGCGNRNFCPNDFVTREQMAAFIVRALEEFNPPAPAGQRFDDVPPANIFYNFIDRLAALQITRGCSTSPPLYCPSSSVTREQMAAFIIRALGEFSPPTPPQQRFNDVPPSNIFYNFIDRMAVRGITIGCSANPPLYCPSDPVTRAQMAAFLVRAFNL